MNVQSIDLGHELRQGAHFRLDLAPVIICRPIARQRLNRRELYSLGSICNSFSFWPLCRVDASAQFGQFGVRNIHMEWVNGGLVRSLVNRSLCNTGLGHGVLLLSSFGFLVSAAVDFGTFADGRANASFLLSLMYLCQ